MGRAGAALLVAPWQVGALLLWPLICWPWSWLAHAAALPELVSAYHLGRTERQAVAELAERTGRQMSVAPMQHALLLAMIMF